MTESVFNSTFELELRILLLMSAAKKRAFSVERIISLDFIVCYAGIFQLPYLNPQGKPVHRDRSGRRRED